MIFRRKAYDQLLKWKNKSGHKPLIVEGLRQIGKSYIVDLFGSNEYKHKVVFDFRHNKTIRKCFQGDLDVDSILSSAYLYLNESDFVPGETLLIFEEINDCAQARAALKSFALDGRFDVIGTGSLLGVDNVRRKQKLPIPTGYEDYLSMNPMDFEEFLWAFGVSESAMDLLMQSLERREDLPIAHDAFFKKMIQLYGLLGGMPEVIQSYLSNGNNYIEARHVQERLLHDYVADFGRFINDNDVEEVDYRLQSKLNAIFNSIPPQLGRENGNTKFKFSDVAKGARASQFEDAIIWLENAGLIIRVFDTNAIEIPLECNKDITSYKMFFADIGLLMASLPIINAQEFMDETLGSRKGSIYENLMATMIRNAGFPLYYYGDATNHLEIDFLLETKDGITLLEEKSTNGKMAASKAVMEERTNFHAKKCIKVIKNGYGKGEFFESIPLYVAPFYLKKEAEHLSCINIDVGDIL